MRFIPACCILFICLAFFIIAGCDEDPIVAVEADSAITLEEAAADIYGALCAKQTACTETVDTIADCLSQFPDLSKTEGTVELDESGLKAYNEALVCADNLKCKEDLKQMVDTFLAACTDTVPDTQSDEIAVAMEDIKAVVQAFAESGTSGE